MSKYYLNIYCSNGNCETLAKGSLEQIDDFIIENNIDSVNDLYEYSTNKISKHIKDNVQFKIEYKHKEQIKEKPILYRSSIKSFRKNDFISQDLHELIIKDSVFNKKFFAKYFKNILELDEVTPILKHISKYLKERSQANFNGFYYAYITKKKEKYQDNESGCEEIKVIYSYTKKRDLFEFMDTYQNGKADNRIFIKPEDEFDELLFNDQNPDTGLIIPTVEERTVEIDEEKEPKSVKRLRKTPKVHENQISLFDN